MIKLISAIVLIYTSYYTFTYAVLVWKKENNKIGSIAIMMLAVMVLAIPMFFNQLQGLLKSVVADIPKPQ